MEYQITDDMLEHARIIIREIAREYGVPEAEVRADMLGAMRAGMENPDPEVQKQWREIPWRGQEPTAEEFILWMARKTEGVMEDSNLFA